LRCRSLDEVDESRRTGVVSRHHDHGPWHEGLETRWTRSRSSRASSSSSA
jgi:hypothetical protein